MLNNWGTWPGRSSFFRKGCRSRSAPADIRVAGANQWCFHHPDMGIIPTSLFLNTEDDDSG
jgi:hypothetical protein